MRDSLQAYVSIDTSNSLSEHFIMIITDVFEHLHESKQIQDIFNLPEHVAQTVLNIKHAISALWCALQIYHIWHETVGSSYYEDIV